MDLGLRGRAALVTGASRGLGKAVAGALAAEGARVAICARNRSTLEAAAQELASSLDVRAAGGEVVPLVADVTVPKQISALVAAAQDRVGPIEILVANAGGPPAMAFVETDDPAWQNAVDMNLMTTVRLCREVIPGMRAGRWGRIIAITSYVMKQPLDGLVLSNAVRLAVAGVMKTLANELGPDNILVNTVCPGPIATDRLVALTRTFAEREGLSEADAELRLWTGDLPLRRLGRAEEFGAVVAFLASERASFVTGAVLQIDGGKIKGVL